MRNWFIGLLAVAALVLVLMNFAELRNFIELLRHMRPGWLVAASLLQLSTYVSVAAGWAVVLRAAGSPRSIRTLVPISVSKLFADQVVPTAGISGNVLLVDQLTASGVPRGHAVSALLVSVVAYYAAFALSAVCVLLLLWLHHQATPLLAVSVYLFLLVAAAIPTTALLLSRRGRKPSTLFMRAPLLHKAFQLLQDAPAELVRNRTLIARVAFLNLLVFIADAATLQVALLALGEPATFGSAFIAFILASIAVTLAPLPLGLGSFEAVSIGMLRLLGISLEAAIAATLLLRGFTLWLPLILGFFLSRRMMKDRKARPENSGANQTL